MKFELLDTVVLERDLPEHHLRRGDLGTIVELYPPSGLEVEFIAGSGKARALLTVRETDVRAAGDSDLLSCAPSITLHAAVNPGMHPTTRRHDVRAVGSRLVRRLVAGVALGR